MDTPQRLHSLDNLRAAMMWLGIVLHVAAIHMVGESPLIWRDKATSPLADLLLAFIHSFRMPVFFIVAGFFAALLVQSRGPMGMLKHRFRRIAVPFLVFWLPLVVLTVVMVMLYVHLMHYGRFGIEPALAAPPPGRPMLNTMHLWFIYLLWWFAVATAFACLLSQRLSPAWSSSLPRLLRWLGGRSWGFLVLTLPLLVAGASYPNGFITPSGSLLPPWTEWLHNGLFFAFGWALFGARETLLPRYAQRCWRLALAGLPFFAAMLVVIGLQKRGMALPHAALLSGFAYNAATWLWSLAIIGLFLRYLPQHSRWLAYLSDSAYWVYLAHLPLTVGFGALIYGLPLGALAKMLLNISLTTLICLASYQLLVRGRWLGRLLNGEREKRAAASHLIEGAQA